jgi:hypothetical protein
MTDKLFYRHMELNRESFDEEKRTVDVIFSTENPVWRYWQEEYEILLHGAENVDFERLLKTGSGLLNHSPDKIVGPLSNMTLSDFRGVATLGFDDDEIGNMALGKVRSGSLRGVSVGYDILDAVRVHNRESYEARPGFMIHGPAFVATRWEPGEISLTPIPADIGSTVARSRSLDGVRITEIGNRKQPERKPKKHIIYNHSLDLIRMRHERRQV